jgi:hypothetical protein
VVCKPMLACCRSAYNWVSIKFINVGTASSYRRDRIVNSISRDPPLPRANTYEASERTFAEHWQAFLFRETYTPPLRLAALAGGSAEQALVHPRLRRRRARSILRLKTV